MSDKLLDIDVLMKNFREATEEYDLAHASAESARSRETTALNNLSAAQKAIDEWHESVKNKAPWNSEWHQQRRRNERSQGE